MTLNVNEPFMFKTGCRYSFRGPSKCMQSRRGMRRIKNDVPAGNLGLKSQKAKPLVQNQRTILNGDMIEYSFRTGRRKFFHVSSFMAGYVCNWV